MAKPSWPRIRKAMEQFNTTQLLEVIKSLYELNKANQAFLAQRFDAIATENPLTETTQRVIDRTFYLERGFPTFKAGPARKALREFQKAATALEGIEMGLYYVQQGIRGTNAYGDIDEPFYNSIESAFEDTLTRIRMTPNPSSYLPRLRQMVDATRNIGWGFPDQLEYLLEEFEGGLGA